MSEVLMTRTEWDAFEAEGRCPLCRLERGKHVATCRKRWFDRGYSVGHHDGANHMPRHDDAFYVEIWDDGEIDEGESV